MRVNMTAYDAFRWVHDPDANPSERFDDIACWFYSETGYMRPGKSQPLEMIHTDEERQRAWDEWLTEKQRAFRDYVWMFWLNEGMVDCGWPLCPQESGVHEDGCPTIARANQCGGVGNHIPPCNECPRPKASAGDACRNDGSRDRREPPVGPPPPSHPYRP